MRKIGHGGNYGELKGEVGALVQALVAKSFHFFFMGHQKSMLLSEIFQFLKY